MHLRSSSDSRLEKTAFGSPLYARANKAACACAEVSGSGIRAQWARLRAGLLVVIWYLRLLPSTEVALSDEQTGRMIRQHLMMRENGHPRFRRAQGVLWLPEDYADYLRGRRRQAVRTNISRAREGGLTVHSEPIECWAPGPGDLRAEYIEPGPSESWWVTDPSGAVAAHGVITVDRDTAMIQGLVSNATYARWLLHSAIVERLCGSCKVLLTNSHEAPRMRPGDQHFQRLLGYSIFRLRVRQSWRERLADVPFGMAGLCLVAAAMIVAADLAPGAIPSVGERALVWLTALVAVRVASGRAGLAAATGAIAGLSLIAVDGFSNPAIPAVYFLAGIVIDALLAIFPRFTWSAAHATPVGVAAMFVTIAAPAFPTIGHHPLKSAWLMSPLLGAIVFGAIAAALGWRLGKALTPIGRLRAG
jgi:hypothetical protein